MNEGVTTACEATPMPTRMDYLRGESCGGVRSIKIDACLNGYILRVGCQTLVAVDKDFMLKELGRYLDDPYVVEREYMTKFGREPMPQPNTTPSATQAEIDVQELCNNPRGFIRSVVSKGN